MNRLWIPDPPRIRKVDNLRRSPFTQFDTYRVEAVVDRLNLTFVADSLLTEPPLSDPAASRALDLHPLPAGDRLEWTSGSRTTPSLDLHEGDDLTPPDDEIDLPVSGPPVPSKDLPPVPLQMPGSQPFAEATPIMNPGHASVLRSPGSLPVAAPAFAPLRPPVHLRNIRSIRGKRMAG